MKNAGLVALACMGLFLIASPSRAERDDDNLRNDVLQCEDAVAHAQDCCGPEAVDGLECLFLHDEQSGCGGSRTEHAEPDLYASESACVRDTSCETMRSRGMCERIKAVPRMGRRSTRSTTSEISGAGSTSTPAMGHPAVCP